MVAGVGDTVELQQPVPEALADLHLPRAEEAGGVVIGDKRLRARTTGGAANGKDRLHRLLVRVLAQLGNELRALREHLARESHECADLQISVGGG